MLTQQNYNLSQLNTFGVDATAEKLVEVETLDDLFELSDHGLLKENPVLFLGQGSNLLFTRHFPGLVILNRLTGRKVVEEDDDFVFLRVSAGESWPELVDYTVSRGWGGLENLSLIPGSAGAAPVQNIGAYGVEIKDVLDCVEAFDLQTGELKTFSIKRCGLGYRTSIFKTTSKGRYLITSILIKLAKVPVLNLSYKPLKEYFKRYPSGTIGIREVSEAVKAIRRSKLPEPAEIGNAGSFFKNPLVSSGKINQLKNQFPGIPFFTMDNDKYKIAAGWLIEQCGWKGKRIGDAGVYDKQALVLVNYGKATGKQIFDLSQQIVESVHEKFSITLEREVTVI